MIPTRDILAKNNSWDKNVIFDYCKNINYGIKVLFENFLINKNFKIKTDHHTYLFSIRLLKKELTKMRKFYFMKLQNI
jgi:hypothetical protein